ncbi:MAG: DUF4340 domain-containing protein [Oscillibacter sp.]|nr:DUF4340 domain-containing protein [Oscillibacter sp.]MBQ2996056.1 DUF4340 domain-containing protein [Oscillibacter sp.]
MTWRERRIVTFLSTILGILCIALLIVLGIKYRESRAPEAPASPAAALAGEESACSALRYTNGVATLEFQRNESGKWFWTADDDFPLDDTHLTTILETLSAMTPQQTLESVESLDELGLESPVTTISALYTSGTAFSLAFGSTTADGSSVYATQNGQSSPVYIYSGEILGLLQTGIHDMCTLPDVPAVAEEQVQRVTIQNPANADGAMQRFTMNSKKDGETIRWECDGRTVTNSQRVRDLFTDLSEITFEKCISYRPSQEAAALCGVTNAKAVTLWANYISSTDLEETLQLSIGDLTLDGQSRYVRLNGESAIYSVPLSSLDSILTIALNGFSG